MKMIDVTDAELNQIERNTKQPISNREESDAQLIEMVKQIKEGNKIMTPSSQVQPKIVEPEMPNYNADVTTSNIVNSNYWKITGLPSKGKFYPAGTEILGRPMKVLEVKKISSINEENGDFVLNDIVRKTTKGLPVEEMYVADKLFIIFWLRSNSYRESGYVVPFVCPKCEKKSEYHFEVSTLEVQEISDNFSPDNNYKMINGDTVKYDYLKVKDEIYIDRFKELNRAAIGDIDAELLAMAQMIKSINGKEQTLLQKYYWIVELAPGDYAYLRSLMEKSGMGIKPYVNVTCKDCGGNAPIGVSFRADFFIPEYKAE